jgi:hypothetical protein
LLVLDQAIIEKMIENENKQRPFTVHSSSISESTSSLT